MIRKNQLATYCVIILFIVGLSFLSLGLAQSDSFNVERGSVLDGLDGGNQGTGIPAPSEYEADTIANLDEPSGQDSERAPASDVQKSPFPWFLSAFPFIISAFIALILFARLSTEDVMDGVRQDIFDYISENPGEHLAEITRKFGLSSSSARHHLLVLEWGDKIVWHKQGKRKHYYLNANGYRRLLNGSEYKKIMSTLKNETTRDIVKYLINNENTNQKGISKALNLHPSTINWHAKRLGNVNIISKTRRGKDIVYALNKELQLERVITILDGAS